MNGFVKPYIPGRCLWTRSERMPCVAAIGDRKQLEVVFCASASRADSLPVREHLEKILVGFGMLSQELPHRRVTGDPRDGIADDIQFPLRRSGGTC